MRPSLRSCYALVAGFSMVVSSWSMQSVAEADEETAMVATASPPWQSATEETKIRRTSRHTIIDARATRYLPFLREAARVYQLPIALLWGVARVESAFEERARSIDGACGLMQLLPRTAHSMGVTAIYDPRQNILGGARYLRVLVNRWHGDVVLSVASYNAGPNAVERHLRKGSCRKVLGACVPPYRETMRYVQRVVWHLRAYRDG